MSDQTFRHWPNAFIAFVRSAHLYHIRIPRSLSLTAIPHKNAL
jgi:hypothetical protein